ncbi:MAG: hypothetical protein N2319_08165 [Candidatus Kapabacteria bacterium]|nr:hypothetical protein [Candidatus Kapabacteria bacterium]
MKLFKIFIISVLFLSNSNCFLFSQDTLYVFPNKSLGQIFPTYQRINIWDLTHTERFPAYPHHKYPFLAEANLMTATGGKATNEMYNENGNHNFSILGKAIQNLLDSGLKPIIVIGNTPESLSDMPNEKGAFNSNIGKPKYYKEYYDYISSLFEYLAKTFSSRTNDFQYRLYTEPDFYVWFNNGLEEYKRLYDFTLSAMREGLKDINYTPILHPGNFMAPSKLSDTTSMFYPWTIAFAKWLKEDYKGKFIEAFDSDLKNWDIKGKARILNKELVLSEGRIFSKVAIDWKNYDLTFYSKFAGSGSDGAELGVFLNFKDDNNYILVKFSFGNRGILSVSQKKDGIIKELEKIETNIPYQKDYKFQIISLLDSIKIKINDTPILMAFGEGFDSGKIGFLNENGRNDIIIDNIIGSKYHYVSNFTGSDNWKIKGTNETRKNEIVLSNAEAIFNSDFQSNYKLNFKMKTDVSGEEGSDVGWLIFDYLDSNNYSAFILNYHGYIEYKKIVNGQSIVHRSSWTGLPKPYFYTNFKDTPEDFIFSNLKSGKIENGLLKLKNESYIIGNSNPLFSFECRIRAKLKIQSNNPKAEGDNLIVFNFTDSLNFWGVQIHNNDTLIIKRKVKGKDILIAKAKADFKAGDFNDFDLRVGGDIELVGEKEVWNTIENNITLYVNGKKALSGSYDNGGIYGRLGFLSKDENSSLLVQNYLITYEGDSRGISPLDYHNFELINDDFVKILNIDGITYAVVYDNKTATKGKIGFKANNSQGVHISDLKISDIIPYEAGALPRIPKGFNPRFSYSYYALLQTEGDYQIGMDPKDIKTLTDEIKRDISPYFKDAKIEVAEASIYLDEEGKILDCSDGTDLGSAWNAAIFKSALDVGLEAFTQWGYTSEELRSPSYNLFELLENMKGSTRISFLNSKENENKNFDGLASKNQDTIFILLYNFHPDRQYSSSNKRFSIKINELKANQQFALEESRIDAENSNFFNKWLEYCNKSNISPKAGKSRYDMNIAGAYELDVIEKHWKKQKEYYKTRGDDQIRTVKTEIATKENGNIILPLTIPGNGIIFLKIYPKE